MDPMDPAIDPTDPVVAVVSSLLFSLDELAGVSNIGLEFCLTRSIEQDEVQLPDNCKKMFPPPALYSSDDQRKTKDREQGEAGRRKEEGRKERREEGTKSQKYILLSWM